MKRLKQASASCRYKIIAVVLSLGLICPTVNAGKLDLFSTADIPSVSQVLPAPSPAPSNQGVRWSPSNPVGLMGASKEELILRDAGMSALAGAGALNDSGGYGWAFAAIGVMSLFGLYNTSKDKTRRRADIEILGIKR